MPGAGHLVADAAQHRLDARGAEHRVVDVVEVGRVEVAVAAAERLARRCRGRAGTRARCAARAVQPRSASRSSWRRRIWRGEATTGAPSSHCRSARHSAVPACQGDRPQRVEVRAPSRSRRSRAPTRTSRSRRRCSSRRRRRAGSCRPRRRARRPRRGSAGRVRRLPCRRPCMSVSASRTVSIVPSSGAAQLVERQRGLLPRTGRRGHGSPTASSPNLFRQALPAWHLTARSRTARAA